MTLWEQPRLLPFYTFPRGEGGFLRSKKTDEE